MRTHIYWREGLAIVQRLYDCCLVYVGSTHIHQTAVIEYRYQHTTVLNFCVFNRPKKFKLHTDYSWIWEQINLHNPLVRRQSSSLSPCLSSGNHSRRLFKKTSEGFDSKIMAELLGQCSGTAWAGQTGQHKHRVFPCRKQSLLATICSLWEKVLPLL